MNGETTNDNPEIEIEHHLRLVDQMMAQAGLEALKPKAIRVERRLWELGEPPLPQWVMARRLRQAGWRDVASELTALTGVEVGRMTALAWFEPWSRPENPLIDLVVPEGDLGRYIADYFDVDVGVSA